MGMRWSLSPSAIFSKGKVKRVTIEATVIRADGSTEDLGVIADSRKLPRLKSEVQDWLQRRSS